MAITRRTKGDKTPLWQYLDKADKEKFKEAIDAMEGSRDNAGFFINDLLIPENHPRLPK
jgi:hypothetical protein